MAGSYKKHKLVQPVTKTRAFSRGGGEEGEAERLETASLAALLLLTAENS